MFSLFGKSGIKSVSVDYDTPTPLPRGTVGILKDHPLFAGLRRDIKLGDIKLKPIPSGETGFEYVQRREVGWPGTQFCDGKVLDALVAEATKDAKNLRSAQERLTALGSDRIIYFFGTTFEAENGEVVVSFLNLSGVLPSLRYVTYMIGPMEYLPVPAYAAILEE